MQVLIVLFFISICNAKYLVPASSVPEALYPEWAHYHQVWLASGHNQSDCEQLVRDYLSYNISVGGTDIDSEWSSGINNFEWDTKKFPDAATFVDNMHQLGVRVILWATSMIDTDSSNYAYAKQNDYMLSKGKPIKWWHGHGGLLDFTYPAALEWWKSELDKVLVAYKTDGFKCDGTDPYILLLDLQGGAHGHDGRHVSYREYADLYYGTFLNHSRAVNPYAIMWSRPVDSWNNHLYWHFSPRYASFSGWVGDQNPTFDGLVDALNNMLHSAWAGYVSFGSDTGGYRCCPSSDPRGRTRELLLRWAQLNSFMGLFENGGDNEHRPWMFTQPNITTNIYRFYVNAHHSLATYLLSAGSAAWESGKSIVTPIANQPLLPFDKPSTYAYWLGPSIFVDPITASNVTTKKVSFPKGSDFVDFFNSSIVYSGGSTISYDVTLDQGKYPVFYKRGSLVMRNLVTPGKPFPLIPPVDEPMEVFVPCPRNGDHESITIRKYKSQSQDVSFEMENNQLSFVLSAHPRNVTIVLSGFHQHPKKIDTLSGAQLESWLTPSDGTLRVSVPCTNGEKMRITF